MFWLRSVESELLQSWRAHLSLSLWLKEVYLEIWYYWLCGGSANIVISTHTWCYALERWSQNGFVVTTYIVEWNVLKSCVCL